MSSGEFGIGLIACDIDGCFNPGKNRVNSFKELSVLRQYNHQRIDTGAPPITFISGRPLPFVEAYANFLSVLDYCICENGAMAFHPATGEVLVNPIINDDGLSALYSAKESIKEEIRKGLPARLEPGKEVSVSLNPTDGEMPLQVLLQEVLPFIEPSKLEATHSASAVDITVKGVNKGSGISWLGELQDLHPRNMVGVGDSEGDIPFLKRVGYAGAPNNASEAVKRVVSFISSENFAAGSMSIIDHFLNKVLEEFESREIH